MENQRITKEEVISLAKDLKFDLVGFSKVEILKEEIDKLRDWLAKGYHHEMSYMERNIDKREDVTKILPEAQTVISLGINYYKSDKYLNTPGSGKVSKYAWGKDYHYVIWEKLEKLEEQISNLEPDALFASYVDTGPVMDKVWAVKSGLGWHGKNTNVINRNIGSWFFIANVITNLEFTSSEIQPDLCGNCTACIDACPTNALEEYQLNANKCISNLTIENRGEIPNELNGKFDNWIFGCDICQDVCPWNKKFSRDTECEYLSSVENKEIVFDEIFSLSNKEFKNKYVGSPIYRARLKGLKRNAEFLKS